MVGLVGKEWRGEEHVNELEPLPHGVDGSTLKDLMSPVG